MRDENTVRLCMTSFVTAVRPKLPQQLLHTLFVLLTAMLIGACGTLVSVSLDGTPLAADKATVIIYNDTWHVEEWPVFVDGSFLGHVTNEAPLKVLLEPGVRRLHVEFPVSINRLTSVQLHAGQTYFFRVWFESGMWVGSTRIDLAAPIDSYEYRRLKPGQQAE